MSTRNIVPRNDGEGSLGTAEKKWGETNTNKLTVTTADIETGTADKLTVTTADIETGTADKLT
ncbi:hypothetical protein, partial [uncultured Megasphaera sp.]